MPACDRRAFLSILQMMGSVIAAATIGASTACGGPPAKTGKLPPPLETQSLGPGDVFDVQVYDEPGLSKTYRVAPNGTIDFPLLGTLEVDGKEPQELALLIRDRLRDAKILKNPYVSINVKEVNSKKVSVLGQVQKPGQFPMAEGLTVVHAITLAGGFTPSADRDRVMLTRKVSKTKVVRVVFSVAAMMEGRTNDVPLQAGDTIYVEERVF